MPPASSPDTALKAILPLIAAGDAYSAHQKARTFASRYIKAKSYDTAIDVLFQSARELLKVGQQGSGTDLGAMMIEAYDAKDESISDASRSRLTQLIALTGNSGAWRDTFISKALAWSARASGCPSGDPELQYYLGQLFYQEGSSMHAESHLLSSGTRDSAALLAEVLFEWSRYGSELGSYAARGVIPFLLLSNILAARTFLAKFISLAAVDKAEVLIQKAPVVIEGEDEIWATNDHTLNFLQMTIRLCQRADGDPSSSKEAKTAWIRLCNRYAGGVSTTVSNTKMLIIGGSEMKEAIESLSHMYFDIAPPRSGNPNALGDMMAALLGGGPASNPRGSRPAISGGARGRGGGRGAGTAGLD